MTYTFKDFLLKEAIYEYDNLSDAEMLREAIKEELHATNVYTAMERKTKNPKLKKVFNHVAKEEMVHAEEFKTILKEIETYIEQAEKEAKKELGEYL
jgi:rubrerythrin